MTKAKEVTRVLTQLIGLDRKQFTQIAMIAQGDFQKLLLAGTEERGGHFPADFRDWDLPAYPGAAESIGKAGTGISKAGVLAIFCPLSVCGF